MPIENLKDMTIFGHNLRWNWTEFCGSPQFSIWSNNHQDLSYCFQMLCLQMPVLSLIAVMSAFYAGKYQTWVVRTFREKFVLRSRMLISFLLCVLPVVRLTIQVVNDSNSVYAVNYWVSAVESIAWLVHTCYVSALKHRLGFGLRGPVIMSSLWILLYLSNILRLRSIYFSSLGIPSEKEVVTITFSTAVVVLQTLYAVTLIPSEDSPSRRNTIDIVDQNDVAFRSSLSQYVRFREDFDPQYLGTATDGAGLWSRFLFWWVNPLIEKGARGQLRQADDLFDLPAHLTTGVLNHKLRSLLQTQPGLSLLRALHRRFARQFYGVGLLKLIADLSAFASPLLLSELIKYIEDLQMPVFYGYVFGAGIFLATLVNSFCNVHFDFIAGKINLKLQSTLISLIYQKILKLNPVVFKNVGVGEIVNHVSVDMDRISNSCLSFHTVWSIPLQLTLTLYFLYVQVGVAFLAGVAFSILMIPLNKVLASKIGSYSSRLLVEKDRRVEIMSEVLKGIRVIKLNVWEEFFICKVLRVRVNELKYLKYRKYLDAMCVYFWATTPVVISLLTFTFYVYLGGELKASVIFTSLALLNMLIVPLNAFPWVLNGIIEAWVSVKRVDAFLKNDELQLDKYYGPKLTDDNSLIITDGSFCWTEHRLHLKSINLRVPKGQFVGICGPVGCGKSSLLCAILGEMQKVSGEVRLQDVSKGIGYVSQTPWIQQCTVRDNILFGRPYDVSRYRAVVEACALVEDFYLWTNGDFQVVGEGGTTLSGGQKARIALARAVYQDVDLYLFDDILSAVDVHVANHIFEHCIKKLLEKKTKILVSHSVTAYAFVDWLLVMENGSIVKQGPPSDILDNVNYDDLRNTMQTSPVKINLPLSKRRGSLSDADSQKETSATGSVSKKVYLRYWRSVGTCLGLFILLLVAAMQISKVAVDWWLSLWVTTNTDRQANVTDFYYLSSIEKALIDAVGSNVDYFLQVYTAIGVLNSFIVILRAFFFAYGGIKAAKIVHKNLLRSVIGATMEFFEVSPLGRILNRFSSDVNTVDDALPFDLNILLAQVAAVLGIIFTSIYGIPWLCLFIAPLIPVYHWLQNNYRLASRDLKRIMSVSLSPLYSHINETVSGIPCIRAFNESVRFTRENQEKVDILQKCNISSLAASMWLNIRLQSIGVCVIASVCFIAILQRHFDVAHSGFVGLALTYALTLTGSLGSVVNIFVETERKMVAMERVSEYIENVEAEPIAQIRDTELPFAWPYQGVVSFANVHLQYRDDLSYALKGVSFETISGEKIGIVGRTGSGKSSLFAALFRLTPICEGHIQIDAVDITNVQLKKLRSKLTIIPQDPFLFSDTVRKNLDPLDEYNELELQEVLNKCNIVPLVSGLGGLDATLSSGGSNLSVGERQLLCLARAVLRNSRVVCIDEATASIDRETDDHIQEVIKKVFQHSTVFTIAHRVQTVMDCDRIIFMDHGEIAEYDNPQALLDNPKSHFFRLVNGDSNSSSS